MARRRLYIPDEVKQDIQKHLTEKYTLALEGFLSASEEEDALTGDLGATLRIKNQKVFVQNSQIEKPGEWTWSINYHKFRGRGPGATENKLGADGILELTLKIGSRVEKKSLMFQSKINWTDDPNLIKETIKLTTWREAAFILNFTSKEFEAIDIDSVIASRGKRNNTLITTPLDKYIGTTFLDCIVGDVDLKYDAVSRKLIWRTTTGQVVATKFSIPHKIAIQITAPNVTYGHNLKYDQEILNDKIHDYRMDASEEEMLSLQENYNTWELRKARAKKALIYHSDSHSFGDALLDELMKRRMQEINAAHDKLKQKVKK
ncbi:hypothetical protein [Dyadobacter sp. CY356]|uniref:hypothetical protein n=1 Tax=Dyadobacter sp. CY356 TaxID=2906442 RepID=UPI001F382694|nr:hypothetical protein [Dyadobacter sp. CY356]MCF0055386.1 hypothetical protein [Dyadobacter sp. CY356]